jgi:uncharacterized protein DUF2630
MAEDDLFELLTRLKAERAQLWSQATAGQLDDRGRRRLASVARDMEQCWQRLRQRRAQSRMTVTNDVSLRLSLRCSGTLVRHLDDAPVRCSLAGDCGGLDREHARKLRCRAAGDSCPRCETLRGGRSSRVVGAAADG